MWYSFQECARQLKIGRRAVADLVTALNISVCRHPTNGTAKAIDEAGFLKLKNAINRALQVA